MNMNTHYTGKIIQLKTSSKIKTKLNKKTPPSKTTAHEKWFNMRTCSQKRYKKTKMKIKYNKEMWKPRIMKTQKTFKEGTTQEKGLSASRCSSKEKNMTSNLTPLLRRRKKILCMICITRRGCDIHTDDVQEGNKEA